MPPLAGRRLWFVGIGGAGLSSYAFLARAWGAEVGGWDRAETPYLRPLEGVPVEIAPEPVVPDGWEAIVSSAYPSVAGTSRADFLAELVSLRRSIVVAGAHGKTTTTGMIAFALAELGLDPAWLVGGEIAQLGGNAGAGEGWLVAEGDESDRTVERLRPQIAVVTNVELDHHSTFASAAEVEELFERWLAEVPQVVRGWELEPVSFELRVAGDHNRRNAAAALAALELVGVARADAESVLARFGGATRRFERVGEHEGVTVVDDYAHHPSEIAATVAAAREQTDGRVLVLFQPHLYSRTRHLAHELGAALSTADAVCVTEIYRAREEPIDGVEREARRRCATAGTARRLGAEHRGRCADHGLVGASRRSRADRRRRRRGSCRPAPAGSARMKIAENMALARLTTIGTGGPARAFAKPTTLSELEQALTWAEKRHLRVVTVGLGSNLLASDDGVEALVLRLAGELAAVRVDGETLTAGGGATNAVSLHQARAAGLGGFEFACAIPGTAGGGVWMNAGAYGSDWSQILVRARVVTAAGSGWLTPAELGLSYRHSELRHGQVVAEVEYRLAPRPPEEIKETVSALIAQRKATQPTNKRTFGSVFKNPEHDLGAGRMLEECGLKGHAVGGAVISPKHANFIENAGGATTADALALMSEARRRARERFGVELEHEVELVGEIEVPPD